MRLAIRQQVPRIGDGLLLAADDAGGRVVVAHVGVDAIELREELIEELLAGNRNTRARLGIVEREVQVADARSVGVAENATGLPLIRQQRPQSLHVRRRSLLDDLLEDLAAWLRLSGVRRGCQCGEQYECEYDFDLVTHAGSSPKRSSCRRGRTRP